MKNNTIALSKRGTRLRQSGIFLAGAALLIISIWGLGLDFITMLSRFKNAPAVIKRMLVLDFSQIGSIMSGMLVSITLAVTTLVTSFIIAVPVSFLAAENISPNRYLAKGIKAFVAIIRAVPSLVWVLMVVASIGFGNTGGMIGLIFPSCSYLIKSFTTSIEELGGDLIEAMRSTGASWLSIVTKGLLPTVYPAFVSWLAIRLESNMAESISLGMIGVAGIGMQLMRAKAKFDYGTMSVIILVIFISMFLMELLSTKLRARL